MKRDFKWMIEHPYWVSTSERLGEIDGLCRVRQVDKSSIRKSIHWLLSELFDWQEERIIDEVKCPIYRFVVAALVNTNATNYIRRVLEPPNQGRTTLKKSAPIEI